MAACLSHLQQYHKEEYAFLSRIVTGEETWCHHHHHGFREQMAKPTVETPQFSPTKEIQSCPYEFQGPLLVEFLKRGATTNAKLYADTLRKL
ncbi:hypothetical protein J437_LFUL010869 [Ladona fulva]|uniref:Uncharacterized protein n=1 Tax=Ladona fulva TaxID=123851 RepID=A0A8K0P1N3_LADFU|nr:hypothetical protein J437_LFUL010869 [Ladona fulva]